MNVVITGTGSYIPSKVATNEGFEKHNFYNEDGSPIPQENTRIIEKFKAITGISERRYIKNSLVTSEIAAMAAEKALSSAKADRETLDYIIVAHNYGDVKHDTHQSDTVPSLASRTKHLLKIKNPNCVAYDILFGCPGWLEGVIQAYAFMKAGMASKCLVIGAETLSRVVDRHDRDSMIYSDGAGAVILEASEGSDRGILTHHSATYAYDEAHFIYFGESYNLELNEARRYIKMYGRKIYEFAITYVPEAMKLCLDKSGIPVEELKKIFIHQANEKMDEAIVQRFYKLYGKETPKGIMPMTINKLGNSSVATIPTLFDIVSNGKLEGHSVTKGDVVLFASVGAGMNINAVVYRI
ncbi:MAG: ketoacyl-ACP synthase III [Flavobacteriaceae bacterium]